MRNLRQLKIRKIFRIKFVNKIWHPQKTWRTAGVWLGRKTLKGPRITTSKRRYIAMKQDTGSNNMILKLLCSHTHKKKNQREIFNCMFSLASPCYVLKWRGFFLIYKLLGYPYILHPRSPLLLQIDLAKVLFLPLMYLAHSIPEITGSK